MPSKAWAVAVLAALALSGCSYLPDFGGPSQPAAPAAPAVPAAGAVASVPPPYSVDKLVGNWGVASYRMEKDRARIEGKAKEQCKLPFVIKKGPTDGVLMHVADDPDVHELTLKATADGKVYLGFAGPPADAQDLQILSMTDKMFTARYVDPDTDARFGTLVYVRCK